MSDTQSDTRHAIFGNLVWQMIEKMGEDFFGEELSEEILPLAERAGLCSRVSYDPEKHGRGLEADPGDEIWFWDKTPERAGGEGR